MKQIRQGLLIVLLGLGLTACGTTTGERATSGAGIGAAVGAGTSAVTGGSVLGGAAAGAAVGAGAGAVTDEEDINLDEIGDED